MKLTDALVVVMLVAMMLAISLPVAFAEDGNNVPDQLGDIFSGKGNMYGGVEINHIPLPFVPATLRTGFESIVGKIDDGVKRDIRGYAIVCIDWRDIFK